MLTSMSMILGCFLGCHQNSMPRSSKRNHPEEYLNSNDMIDLFQQDMSTIHTTLTPEGDSETNFSRTVGGNSPKNLS